MKSQQARFKQKKKMEEENRQVDIRRAIVQNQGRAAAYWMRQTLDFFAVPTSASSLSRSRCRY